MRYMRTRLSQPDWMRHPMQQFMRESDALQRGELHAWNLSREDRQYALFYFRGDIEAYRERIAGVEGIHEFELTPVDGESFYSYVCQAYRDADIAFFRQFAELNLVVVPPLVYDASADATVTVVGPGEALTGLVEGLEEVAEVDVTVETVGEYDRRYPRLTGGLTDRQFEAIQVATELGYYTVPREVTLTAVADDLGVAPGTASDLLRRAEANLMVRLVDGGTPPVE
jgi:predicted DNA binding protein